MRPIPYLRAWLLTAIAILACLTLGLSAAVAAEESEGGGGETPPTETPVDPPIEPELPPVEPPVEPELPTETPDTTPESPTHSGETPSEAAGPGPAAPGGPSAQTPSGSSGPTKTPARHQSSGGSQHQPPHTAGGAGKGVKATNPVESISNGVDSIISGALAPQQIDAVGELLADSGLAPRGDKQAQHQTARKIINALGAAALGSGIGLSPPEAPPGPQPIPFVPLHGGPNYLPVVLLVLLLAGVAVVLFYQLRPVIRSRRSRPPLISSLDAPPTPGAGPGRVALPREPARAPERPNPGRRKPVDSLTGTQRL
jgi:hypothetical protein